MQLRTCRKFLKVRGPDTEAFDKGMDLTRIAPTDRQHIQKYTETGFTVSGVAYEGPILVYPKESLTWSVQTPSALSQNDFQTVVEFSQDIDLCLLGCGPRMTLVSSDIKKMMRDVGIGIEPMDTTAACRTFNVLLAEGRAVMAALLPLGTR